MERGSAFHMLIFAIHFITIHYLLQLLLTIIIAVHFNCVLFALFLSTLLENIFQHFRLCNLKMILLGLAIV